MNKIKKNDKVRVIAGKDKGKEGTVIQVFPAMDLIVVEGINIRYKHLRTRQGQQGERVEFSAPIHVSNVQLLSSKSSKPVKVGFKIQDDGSKVRIDKKTGDTLE